MNHSNSCKVFNFNKIMVDVTTRCNLECPVCYRAKDSQEDLSFQLLESLSRKYHGKIISLCGGEPTIREDLPEIIRLFSKRNTVFLVTNGVKLADYEYLKSLKKSGLRYLSFSFNALSDEIYNKINGRSLLDLKLKALGNIKTAGIMTILSVLIAKGLNENQISGILKYCLENRDFIRELRIRTMVPISKYLSMERYTVADLLDIVCKETCISKEDILEELELKKRINNLFGKEIFIQKTCSFDFHLKRKGDVYTSVGKDMWLGDAGKNKISGVVLLFKLLKAYGLRMSAAGFLKTNLGCEKKPWIHDSDIFKIGLRSWPTRDDIDMEENKKCQTGYYMDGKILPFCYANILKDSDNDKIL